MAASTALLEAGIKPLPTSVRDTAELLHVEVYKLTGSLRLVADYRSAVEAGED